MFDFNFNMGEFLKSKWVQFSLVIISVAIGTIIFVLSYKLIGLHKIKTIKKPDGTVTTEILDTTIKKNTEH